MQLQSSQLLQRLKPLFHENFEKFGELGAAVSVWQNGKPIIDLCGGFRDARREHPWMSDTLVLVWSATKGIGSVCLLHVLQEHKIKVDRPVAEFWPEFAQAGKEKITLAQLLSHQAGLCALDRRVDVLDYDAVIRALEVQKPLWPPGTAHGYHARTFGFLLDELVRRIAGKTLSEYWQENFARPLNLDFWIGLPKKQNSRVATMYAAKAGKPNGRALFSRQARGCLRAALSDCVDPLFPIRTAVSAGFPQASRDSARKIFGTSTTPFGHPGAICIHRFADPEKKIAFGYV